MAKQYTKELIKEEFLKMLETQPFKDITIGKLAQRCEINRNTFYYHYEDIYMLVREILQDELDKLDQEFHANSSWEESLIHALSFILEKKRVAQNMFKSMDKEEVDHYLHRICHGVMKKYVDQECELKGIRAQEGDRALIVAFYQAALAGLLIQWMEEGMEASYEAIIFRTGKLFDGNIERSLRISQELGKTDPLPKN
ncbi:MAG: TetR-like C-terminal domain-containing protein [Tissierellia bacterium]|nr:TetR-like C-terminal domain-containing protein [Tissierellia bacterium]